MWNWSSWGRRSGEIRRWRRVRSRTAFHAHAIHAAARRWSGEELAPSWHADRPTPAMRSWKTQQKDRQTEQVNIKYRNVVNKRFYTDMIAYALFNTLIYFSGVKSLYIVRKKDYKNVNK